MGDYINKITFLGENIPIQDEEVRESVEQVKTRLTNVERLAGDTADDLENVNKSIGTIKNKLSAIDSDIAEIKEDILNIQNLSYSSSTETITYS